MRLNRGSDAARLTAGLAAIAAVTALLGPWLQVTNVAIVSTIFLMVVLLVAAASSLWVAIATSMAAMLSLNFFFIPPIGTFTIAEPHNWVALAAFLLVSLVASNLSAVARTRTLEAVGRRDELARLFDLSRDVLMMTDGPDALAVLARAIARRFDLEIVTIALPVDGGWRTHASGNDTITIESRELTSAFAAAQTSLEFDAYARTYAGHRIVTVGERLVRLVPLRVGTKPIGMLAAAGRPIEPGTLDTLAGVVAIAVERAHLLDERKAAELTRQSEQLKTALLASIGHDLRTPLTAIRVAAANVQSGELTPDARRDQSELILAEVERLTRLFQNILDMARIDAGAIAAESRWSYPSEIVSAARDQVEQTLKGRTLVVDVTNDAPVRLDPRIAATALAHLLENAAQYAPAAASIDIHARVVGGRLAIAVRDHGPGIAAADLPHVFDRFYRGSSAKTRTSGTGMGLSIVRGLLAAQQGQVWAENCHDGGAQFTMTVPVETRAAATADAALL